LAGRKRKIAAGSTKRAKQIQVLLMDVDGTLARGVWLQSQADGTAVELKAFDPHDGLGLVLARMAGIRTGFITGRESAALLQRAQEMQMEFIYQKQSKKLPAYEEILKKAGVAESAVAYIGDDLPDIPVMRRVGFAAAVADAAPEVKRAAHFVTKSRGGEGAVREVVEVILKAKGMWEKLIDEARA
jgi:3-deoxy-D-manno-octulosonate 8-phosphate phosphatase (KDO 8-P phosphatase)